jgi:signal transduction histidine kinase
MRETIEIQPVMIFLSSSVSLRLLPMISTVIFSGTAAIFTPSEWLYLAAIIVVITLVITFLFQRKQSKNKAELKKLQSSLTAAQQKLSLLTEDQDKWIVQRREALENERTLLQASLKSMEDTLKATKHSAQRNALLMTKISNTLRTNLNDILGFSALLENEFALKEEKELFEYNENIKTSGEALLHLLNNIIDISKIGAKSFRLHETKCDLTALTKQLIDKFHPAADQKGISIVFQEKEVPLFAADEQAVKHILENLMDNAVRYTRKGFIKVSQTFNGKEIVWTIKDTGIGIDKAYLPDVFEPFRQQTLGYSKNTYHGAGLGLPLVKNMLEIMGGKIEIESEKAVGTTVRVYFPFKKHNHSKESLTPEATQKEKPAKRQDSSSSLRVQGKHLMVLNEDITENKLIKKMLEDEEVSTYDPSVPLMEWLSEQLKKTISPDLLMIELDITGKGKGAEVLHLICEKFPQLASIPSIALSAYPDTGEEERALKEGFSYYLQKPFQKKQLISVVNRALQS